MPATTLKPPARRTVDEPEFFSHQVAGASRFCLGVHDQVHGFQVVCGGSERCSADYHIARNDFPYPSVEFVAMGEGELVLEGRQFHLSPGAVFCYGPGVPHVILCRPDKPMTKYFVDFSGSQAMKYFVRPGPRPGEIAQSTAPEQIAEIFERLIGAGRSDTPFHERITRLTGEHLLLRIAETAVPLGTVDTAAFVAFQRCREWVDRNYRHVKTLSQMALECDVHKVHLCRLFKRYIHRSPWQYVLRLRMRDAALRLQAPNARVRDVANVCGFNDPYQFSRTFHRVLGIWPQHFIELQRHSETRKA